MSAGAWLVPLGRVSGGRSSMAVWPVRGDLLPLEYRPELTPSTGQDSSAVDGDQQILALNPCAAVGGEI